MDNCADFARLSTSWLHWAQLALLANPQVSESCTGQEVRFTSDDHSTYLRRDDNWWVVDTVNDRGQKHRDIARFTGFDLVEKYLIWEWSSAARNVLRLPRLGAELYSRGHNSDVEFMQVRTGVYELRISTGSAVLMEPSATIFSYLMSKSTDEIEQMVADGVTLSGG